MDLTNSSGRLIACADKQIEINLFYSVSLGPAILIWLILAFNKRRKSYLLGCCDGRPGVLVPLNLLDEFEHRWAYAVAFGAITNTIIGIMTGFEGQISTSDAIPAFKVLLSFWRAFETCVNFLPFFACLYTEHVLLGAILGMGYSAMWFAIKLWALVDCANPVPEVLPYLTVASQWPTLFCLGFLVLKFIWYAILYMRGTHKGDTLQRIEDSVVFPFQIDYVKDLLRKPPPDVDWKSKEHSFMKKISIYYKKYFYDSRHHFKFSTRIMCTVMVVFMCNYQMGIVQLYLSETARQGLEGIAISLINVSNLIPQNSTRTFQENVDTALSLLQASWVVSTGLSFLLFCGGFIGTVSNYRTNMLALFRGDRSFYPPRYKVKSADYVANSMKYSGYQIAYAIWGNLIMVFILLLVTVVISFVFVLPAINGNWTTTNFLVQAIILPFCISMGIRLVQLLLSKHFFLQPKLLHQDKDRPLAIENRRWYHVTNYFFFIANVAVGLFSSLARILKGLGIGLFYLGKLDTCVLMSGWEGSDTGFTAYIGMLEVEYAHNHPAMRVFCHLLTDKCIKPPVFKRCKESDEGASNPDNTRPLPRNQSTSHQPHDKGNSSHTSRHPRISCTETHHQSTHKRWLLVYTLLRNPQLIHDRRQGPIEGMSGHPTTSSLLTESSAHYHQLKALVATIEMRAESQRTKASILDPDKREIMIKDTMNGAELQHVPSPTVECPIDGEFTDGQSAITDVSNTDLIEELVSKPTTDISKIVINRILISNRVGDCDSEQPTTTVKENTSF